LRERDLAKRLARLIEQSGPISVAHYMGEANAYYYGTRDPLGARGDFITAPEISQMFGELIGAWLADVWQRSGSPAGCHYVELGPGRGTLAADALRAMESAGLEPTIELVETSPALRALQAERLPEARWHDYVDSLPEQGPLLIVANEFFDALPIRQWIATDRGWSERMIDMRDGHFVAVAGPTLASGSIPDSLRDAEPGTVIEASPASAAIARGLADRLAWQDGAMLVVDYGHVRTAAGDTLQAMRAHDYADPWRDPGEADLTAHVDFHALADAIRPGGVRLFGPVEQGHWLREIGIDLRAEALSARYPQRASEIAAALARLTGKDQMGSLFKVMAITAPDWAIPAGFA
jgi:SAM-dependent MidA family methyltransferase